MDLAPVFLTPPLLLCGQHRGSVVIPDDNGMCCYDEANYPRARILAGQSCPLWVSRPLQSSVLPFEPDWVSLDPLKVARSSQQEQSWIDFQPHLAYSFLIHSLPGISLLPCWSWNLSEARQEHLMKWSQPSKRRPGGGVHNHPDPEVWETNDFCVRQMGESSYSSLMRLQLRGSQGINSSRRGKKTAGAGTLQGPLLKVTRGHKLEDSRG